LALIQPIRGLALVLTLKVNAISCGARGPGSVRRLQLRHYKHAANNFHYCAF